MVARTVHALWACSDFHPNFKVSRQSLPSEMRVRAEFGMVRTSFVTNRNRKHFWSELFDTASLFGCRISCICRCRHNGEVYDSLVEVDVREPEYRTVGIILG